jgi:hypothetical protein
MRTTSNGVRKNGFAQRLAVGCVEGRATFAILVADRAINLALVDELGGEHVAIAQLHAILVELLHHDGEPVAVTQVEREVDVVAEELGEFHHHADRQTRLLAGNEERAVDRAGDAARVTLELGGQGVRFEAVLDALHVKRAHVVELVAQLQEIVAGLADLEVVAGLDAAQLTGVGAEVEDRHPLLGRQALGFEDRAQRLARLDANGAPFAGLGNDERVGHGRLDRLFVGHGLGDVDVRKGCRLAQVAFCNAFA